MSDNAADRKDIRRREKADLALERMRAGVVRNIMSTTEGRHWIWDILASCGIFRSTFTSDALLTAFNEGQRAVGLRILADILIHCPDAYIQAQRESNVRSATSERRSSSEPDGGDPGREPSADDPEARGDDPGGDSADFPNLLSDADLRDAGSRKAH